NASKRHASVAGFNSKVPDGDCSERGGLYFFDEDKIKDLNHTKSGPYEICHKAKQTREPFPTSDHKTSNLGDLGHLDVWSPYKTDSSDIVGLSGSTSSRKDTEDTLYATETSVLEGIQGAALSDGDYEPENREPLSEDILGATTQRDTRSYYPKRYWELLPKERLGCLMGKWR
ncbi:hypothetical protein Tco_0986840, partial [Tanacetum coccineum]